MEYVNFNNLLKHTLELAALKKCSASFLTSKSQMQITENMISIDFYEENYLLPP